jgi:hypothetical protein
VGRLVRSSTREAQVVCHRQAPRREPRYALSINARAQKVLQEALLLTADERTEVARELIESLRTEPAPEVADSWAELISRRAQQVLDGTASTRDLDATLGEIEARARNVAR